MDALESIGMLGIMAGQSNNRRELEDLNNTLKQIAAAKGIRIKSAKELEEEQKYRERFLEARKRGMTVEQYNKVESDASFFVTLFLIGLFLLIWAINGNFAAALIIYFITLCAIFFGGLLLIAIFIAIIEKAEWYKRKKKKKIDRMKLYNDLLKFNGDITL